MEGMLIRSSRKWRRHPNGRRDSLADLEEEKKKVLVSDRIHNC